MLKHGELTSQIRGAAIDVHRELGPGLLESAYQECLCFELESRRIPFQREVEIPVAYKGKRLNCGYRIDVLVEDKVILELKAVEAVTRVHEAQLLTYMKLSSISVGLLMNFNVSLMKDGIQRFVL